MKAIPKSKVQRARTAARPMPLPRQEYRDDVPSMRPQRPRKRRKGLGRRMLEEIWDVVEDIFD
jgi:hypothetical protein